MASLLLNDLQFKINKHLIFSCEFMFDIQREVSETRNLSIAEFIREWDWPAAETLLFESRSVRN